MFAICLLLLIFGFNPINAEKVYVLNINGSTPDYINSKFLYHIDRQNIVVSRSKPPDVATLSEHTLKFHYESPSDKLVVMSVDKPESVIKDINKRLFSPITKIHHIKHHFGEGQYMFIIHFTPNLLQFQNDTISALTTHPAVIWIDYHRKIHTHNYAALPLMAPSEILSMPWGTEQLITVGDTGVDLNSCYFKGSTPLKLTYDPASSESLTEQVHRIPTTGKVAAYVNMHFTDGTDTYLTDFEDTLNGHGTDVCGSAVGDDSKCNVTNHAPVSGSRLIIFDFEGPMSNGSLSVPMLITPLMEFSYAAGSRIFSNSWGTSSGSYSLTSLEVDWFTYIHDDYAVVFAVGNTGPDPSSIGSPATCKNCWGIGASQNTHESFRQASPGQWELRKIKLNQTDVEAHYSLYNEGNICGFSSRGPTSDGRIKPDLVAPGEYILSARSHGSARWPVILMRGTSMATPLASSMIALTRDILQKQYRQSPSWHLIKNIMITSAVPLIGQSDNVRFDPQNNVLVNQLSSKPLTNMDYGWGRIDLRDLVNGKLTWFDRVPIESYVAPFRYCWVATKSEVISIGLVWPDPPGYMRGKKTIINDLNLRVIIRSKDGVFKGVYHGNGGVVPDNVNTVERVRTAVTAGDFITVIISAVGRLVTRHPIKVQTFSLVIPSQFDKQDCSEDCSEWDPAYECLTLKHEYGQRICLEGRYSGVCYPLCGEHEILNSGKCVCNTHIPCTIKGTNLPAFKKCTDTGYGECEMEKRAPSEVRRVLTVTVQAPTVHYGVGATITISMLIIVGVLMFIYK